VVCILETALRHTVALLHQPTQRATGLVEDCAHLVSQMKRASVGGWISSPSSLLGKKVSNPVWFQLSTRGKDLPPSDAVLVYLGCAVLISISKNKPIPKIVAEHLEEIAGINLSSEAIQRILTGLPPDQVLGNQWPSRLARNWREVVRIFSNGDIPPPGLLDRVQAQLLSSALNTTARHAAGASDHRQLSNNQAREAHRAISKAIEKDEYEGALGVLAVRTGLSIDLLMNMPISRSAPQSEQQFFLDIANGVVSIHLGIAIHEPAQALKGCHLASHQMQIHLPKKLSQNLLKRFSQYPSAHCLADLYPERETIKTDDSIYPSRDEIVPSWARLRHTTGPLLLDQGLNALHAALATLDLGLLCRSKLHYAMVPAGEMHEVERLLYSRLGWGEPTDLVPDSMGFGCRVVPLEKWLIEHDLALRSFADASHPGNHASLFTLTSFHNQFTTLVGWRLSVLLALRATTRINLSAAINEKHDEWISVHDKHTKEDRGQQPVPLCAFAAETIRLYKAHCAAMGQRVANLMGMEHPFARWCKAVAASSNMRLLCTVNARGEIKPLRSSEFTSIESSDYTLPPDVGRKVMENHLRWEGLPASHIDMVLRHHVAGQIRLSSFNAASMSVSMRRTSSAIERVAMNLFGNPVIGLARD
jgi:hypothetical protein